MSREEFCDGIIKAIKDEKTASELYLRTAKCAPRRSISRIIMGIRADERRHRSKLVRIYNEYCSQLNPPPAMD